MIKTQYNPSYNPSGPIVKMKLKTVYFVLLQHRRHFFETKNMELYY